MDQTSADWQTISLEFEFAKLDIEVRKKVRYAKFIEMGKDIEYWGGNYGARLEIYILFVLFKFLFSYLMKILS